VLATGGAAASVKLCTTVNRRVFLTAVLGDDVGLYVVGPHGLVEVDDFGGQEPSALRHPTLPLAIRSTAVYTASSDSRGRELFAWSTQPTTTRLRAARRWSSRQVERRQVRVRVTVRGGSFAQTGRVVVRDGARTVGAGRVVGGAGTVRITRRLGPGRHRLTARYLGSTAGRSSTSSIVRVVVARPR
jgi:hypothetical protein